jgi:hypothetical protein
MYWIAGGVVALLVPTLFLLLRRRARRVAARAALPAREAAALRGREAIRGMERHRRRTGRPTIRGEGGGGNDQIAQTAAHGTDTSSGI